MSTVPVASELTAAPLRHRLRLHLNAPVADVWALVGNHERFPEYCGGIARVTVDASDPARVCHFRSPDGTNEIALRERIRWQAPEIGYATSAVEPNPFGLTSDLGIVTVTAIGADTELLWQQHYESSDLATARASFDEGLADIGIRLVARFGGAQVERLIDATP